MRKEKAGSLDSSGLSGFSGAVASIQQSAASVVSQGLRELRWQKYPQTYPFPCATPVSAVYEAMSRVALPGVPAPRRNRWPRRPSRTVKAWACGRCGVAGQRLPVGQSRSYVLGVRARWRCCGIGAHQTARIGSGRSNGHLFFTLRWYGIFAEMHFYRGAYQARISKPVLAPRGIRHESCTAVFDSKAAFEP